MRDASPSESSPEDELFAPTREERNLALIAHLSGCAGVIVGGLTGFVGPLLIYLLKKDSSAYVEEQAREALNFQITVFVVTVVVLVASCGMLFPILLITPVLQVIFGVLAAVAVRDGEQYRYPLTIRFLQ